MPKKLCDICGKGYKNVKLHKKLAHKEEGMVKEVSKVIGDKKEDIARILFKDVVVVLANEVGFPLRSYDWEKTDKEVKANYYATAAKILRVVEGIKESNRGGNKGGIDD